MPVGDFRCKQGDTCVPFTLCLPPKGHQVLALSRVGERTRWALIILNCQGMGLTLTHLSSVTRSAAPLGPVTDDCKDFIVRCHY